MPLRRNPYVLFIVLFPISFIPRFFGGNLERWAFWLLFWYVLIPLVVSLALGFRPGELGLKLPRDNWKIFGLLMTLAVIVSFGGLLIPSMRDYYPDFAYSGWVSFLEKELVVGVVMLAHEAFFRGFLLFPLAEKNERLAVLAQDVPYAIVHIGKPLPEIPYSFFAGLVFAWMDLRGKSFFQSFLLHWLGSAFFDVLCALFKVGIIHP
ncbi:CPBP family archaeomyxosortase MrtA [Thermococcus waiotapuensis]|uniref:CPBP family archaeomyxosortase MrtA n=1 Tax=Thermococcus waiotapuensis TaxID=90909 RepID=A0AAE4NVI0_9EURY|nr:CPBP family archaeomyxosortase MrtA [Thermococcus waiotapuensis]MDV3103427.1 CPBP family archaeomyxosortase MrtA [Thermococcus waiotapuensis]